MWYYSTRNLTNFTDYSCEKYAHVYFNVTCEYDTDYTVVLYGYIAPFLVVLTAISNALMVAVLSRPHMRTPTNIFLMAIAFCDMLTVLPEAPWNFYFFTLGNHYKPLGPATVCQAWRNMSDVIPTMFHGASIWLTVALAIQRYIYVCHASVARTWCTRRRVVQCLICIGMANFLFYLPRFLDTQVVPHKTVWRGQLEDVCQWSVPSWIEGISIYRYFAFYAVLNVFFAHIIPCVSILAFKAALIRAMRTAQRNRKGLFKDNQKSETKRLRDIKRTTLMLIVIFSVILLVELPVAVYLLLKFVSLRIVRFLDEEFLQHWSIIFKFIGDFSYPINFAIYCGMSQQFRETFKSLFIRNY